MPCYAKLTLVKAKYNADIHDIYLFQRDSDRFAKANTLANGSRRTLGIFLHMPGAFHRGTLCVLGRLETSSCATLTPFN